MWHTCLIGDLPRRNHDVIAAFGETASWRAIDGWRVDVEFAYMRIDWAQFYQR
jgi:hypothetical protein